MAASWLRSIMKAERGTLAASRVTTRVKMRSVSPISCRVLEVVKLM